MTTSTSIIEIPLVSTYHDFYLAIINNKEHIQIANCKCKLNIRTVLAYLNGNVNLDVSNEDYYAKEKEFSKSITYLYKDKLDVLPCLKCDYFARCLYAYPICNECNITDYTSSALFNYSMITCTVCYLKKVVKNYDLKMKEFKDNKGCDLSVYSFHYCKCSGCNDYSETINNRKCAKCDFDFDDDDGNMIYNPTDTCIRCYYVEEEVRDVLHEITVLPTELISDIVKY
jgi:hypothetical protein